MEETGFTLEGRVLCPDDACIGTIASDRRCKLCGRLYEGDVAIGDAPPAAAVSEPAGPLPGAAETPSAVQAAAPDERVCCPDDACTGVIGADGKCGVCGRAAP